MQLDNKDPNRLKFCTEIIAVDKYGLQKDAFYFQGWKIVPVITLHSRYLVLKLKQSWENGLSAIRSIVVVQDLPTSGKL